MRRNKATLRNVCLRLLFIIWKFNQLRYPVEHYKKCFFLAHSFFLNDGGQTKHKKNVPKMYQKLDFQTDDNFKRAICKNEPYTEPSDLIKYQAVSSFCLSSHIPLCSFSCIHLLFTPPSPLSHQVSSNGMATTGRPPNDNSNRGPVLG